ncbi:unnamed protein product [Brassicogethes aeneus]|uniref:Major facilitator superfamily (MFS) profile domain-containing protein n=1 Tax=Brassicogethes aeneus TaxID=1431903 RepID=A0A9P0AVX6_BRAAE|nr:unnamed protein product [Brassicogethes aeneus]
MQKKVEKEKPWAQIFAVFTVSLSSISIFIFLSWPSTSIKKLTADKVSYNISDEEASYFTVVPPVASILISPVISKLNDQIGRKYTILTIGVLQIISWVLIIFAKSIWMFYLSRCFYGMAESGFYTSVPLYIAEICAPKIRETGGNFMMFVMYLGLILSNAVGSSYTIREEAFIFVCFPVLFVVIFMFMPESPTYLIMINKDEEARNTLKWLTMQSDVEEDFTSLKNSVHADMLESGTWTDLFCITSNRKALCAGVFLRLSQQLAGLGTFCAYTQVIFEKAGGNLSPTLASSIITGCLCIFIVTGFFVLDALGRKKTYITSTFFSGVSLLVISIYFFLDEHASTLDLTKFTMLPFIASISYTFFVTMGLATLPVIMPGELFSTSIKTKGLALLNIEYAFCLCFMTKLFYELKNRVGMFCPFLLFGVSCLVATVVSFFVVPETKGKTLEEIQQDLRRKNVQ